MQSSISDLKDGDGKIIRSKAEPFKRNTRRKLRAKANLNAAVEVSDNIERIEKAKDPEAIEFIKQILKNHFVFTFSTTQKCNDSHHVLEYINFYLETE